MFGTVYEIVEIAPSGARSAVKEWWSDGTIQLVKTKFGGGLTTQTTLEKIWDEEL